MGHPVSQALQRGLDGRRADFSAISELFWTMHHGLEN